MLKSNLNFVYYIIMIVHQIYGLYDDGKEMPPLFQASNKAWREYCDKNNHIYKLWDKKQVEELIDTYANLKYYYGVKYPIMKVDIARFIIIYQFGGLYVDLDVLPNKEKIDIDENKLCLCKYVNKKEMCDIEMIYAPKQYFLLWEFVALYVPKQIEEKDNIDIYKKWRVRYVFQTTGPQSFIRFIKYKSIDYDLILTLSLDKYIKFKDIETSKIYNIEDVDCISYYSISYNPHKKYVSYKK